MSPIPVLIVTALATLASTAATITVDLSAPGKPVPKTLHGLFFEDINYAADGGLYAELVQNRSFEHRGPLYSWSETARDGAQGKLTVEREQPLNINNLTFLRIHVGNSGGSFGAANSGFEGIALNQGDKYVFSSYIRHRAGDKAALQVLLENATGGVLAKAAIADVGRDWKKVELPLTSSSSVTNGRLVLLVTGAGAVDVDMVSLFPEKTFKGRSNGLRTDLAQALADLKPGFMRFPGGCIVEGRDHTNMYRWKDTIGDVAERKQNWNLWLDRTSPQYHQTYGLGFYEYFLLCEDMGAEPAPVVNCGMCCQARRGRHIPLDQLSPYVQDALDLIEFANGPVDSKWGSVRAAMGHPKPFNMKLLGVGNEQWNQEYFDRYDIFYKAIKAKYPNIQIVSTSGPHPDDPLFKFAWNKFNTGTPAQVVDEHYYRPPEWFLENNNRYDSYDRKGPKVFAGEYAAHESNRRNTLRSAIAEAAFATGLWRNADVVEMTSYAPLFAKYGHVQWRPDLIWFDNTRVVLTPNYHVQAMLGQNVPTEVVPVKIDAPLVEPTPLAGRIGVGTWKTQAEFKDITVTRDGQTLFQSDFSKGTNGWDMHDGKWEVVDGVLRQTSDEERVRAFIGDPSWTDYTLSVKARKISGPEGFLISFASQNPDTVSWWNLAGWENTQHGLEAPGTRAASVPGKVETNRWYDIRVELKGAGVKCYLDDKLVLESKATATPSLFGSAGRDAKTGEVILAVANPTGSATTGSVNFSGGKSFKPKARAIVLTSANPADENTLEEPSKVKPREETVQVSGPKFDHTFPAWSFTVLRLDTR